MSILWDRKCEYVVFKITHAKNSLQITRLRLMIWHLWFLKPHTHISSSQYSLIAMTDYGHTKANSLRGKFNTQSQINTYLGCGCIQMENNKIIISKQTPPSDILHQLPLKESNPSRKKEFTISKRSQVFFIVRTAIHCYDFVWIGLVFCRNNGWMMEHMDKGLTLLRIIPWTQGVLIVWPKYPKGLKKFQHKMSAEAQKFWIFEKSPPWVSVVRNYNQFQKFLQWFVQMRLQKSVCLIVSVSVWHIASDWSYFRTSHSKSAQRNFFEVAVSLSVSKQAQPRNHSSITSSKRWVGGVKKWQFFMIYSTVNHQRDGWVGGPKKAKNMFT